MNKAPVGIVTVGYAKRALEKGTREHERMKDYASLFAVYHMIIFTRKLEGFPDVQQVGNLYLHATNAYTRLGMVWRAWRIGRAIVADKTRRYVVTSQDPFETALVGRAVAGGNRATNHVQLHGDLFNPRSYHHSFVQSLRVMYGRYVVRHTASIRAVSNRIKRSLVLLGVPESSITVLPIHADLKHFLKVGAGRTTECPEAVSFLYVGRFSPEKNVPLLLTAFAEVARQYPKTSLTLLGDGPQKKELLSLCADLGIEDRVTILPWSDNVSTVMARHDVFCLASDHEGWGMVLLEAAAAGMPIVTTDVGCAGECVRDSENGFVVPVGNKSAYTDAMKRYCKDQSLITKHGIQSHAFAKEIALSEDEYRRRVVDVFTVCIT